MIAGEGTQLIHRPAKDIYELILDFEQYKKADLKIGTVHAITWSGDQAEIHYSGCFRGFTTPAVRQIITVQPYRRIDVRSKPGTFADFMSRFHGSFTFEALSNDVTRVFHREELVFRRPLKWLIEPMLGPWLVNDTAQEVVRLKALLEGTHDGEGRSVLG